MSVAGLGAAADRPDDAVARRDVPHRPSQRELVLASLARCPRDRVRHGRGKQR